MTHNSTDARDLNRLAVRIGLPGFSVSPDGEDDLEAAALALRRAWFERAHKPADSTLKSPCAGTTVSMPGGDTVPVGYERDLDVSLLEERGAPDHPTPDGWTSSRVLCRSGQSTLSCLLHLVTSTGAPAAPLTLHHAGRYFESKALVDVWPRHVFRHVPAAAAAVDILLAEPVFCDGRFGVSDPRALPRAQHALLLDTTLVGTAVDLSPWFDRFDGALVAVFRSGLKLDQAGLELANVGITQLFARAGTSVAAADNLRRIRGLTGSGLTLDELAALSAPWFLDRHLPAGLHSRDIRPQCSARQRHRSRVGGLRGALSPFPGQRRRRSTVLRRASARRRWRRPPSATGSRRRRGRAPRAMRHAGRLVRLSRPSLRIDRTRS